MTSVGAVVIGVGVLTILLNKWFARGTMALQAKLRMVIYPNTTWARVALIVIGVGWIAVGTNLVVGRR